MTGTQSLTLVLGETLDVSVCETVHAELRDGLRRAKRLVLDARAVTEVDVTFLQMLAGAQRSAERDGKAIAFAQPPAGALAVALARCGFNPPPQASALAEILLS